jgi:hypothetical protein
MHRIIAMGAASALLCLASIASADEGYLQESVLAPDNALGVRLSSGYCCGTSTR